MESYSELRLDFAYTRKRRTLLSLGRIQHLFFRFILLFPSSPLYSVRKVPMDTRRFRKRVLYYFIIFVPNKKKAFFRSNMCNTCFFRLIFWFSSSDSTFFLFYSLVSGLPCVKCATGSDRHKEVATARFVQFRFSSQRNTRKPFVARMRARLCFCPFYSFGFLGPLPHTL